MIEVPHVKVTELAQLVMWLVCAAPHLFIHKLLTNEDDKKFCTQVLVRSSMQIIMCNFVSQEINIQMMS